MAETKKSNSLITFIAIIVVAVLVAGAAWFFLTRDSGKYTFSYELDGKTVTVKADDFASLKEKLPTTPTKDGYVFGGYFFDKAYVTPLTEGNFSAKVKAGETVKISIKWYDAKTTNIQSGLLYTLGAAGIKIFGCVDNSITELVIPDIINGFPVTEIVEEFFTFVPDLESITLTNYLIKDISIHGSLGNAAPKLKKVIFPSCDLMYRIKIISGTYIDPVGYDLYIGESKLENLEIPADKTEIEPSWFRGVTSIKSVTIPASVTSIGDSAFKKCTSLASVIFIGDSQLTSISNYAFGYCSNLISVTIPNSVTSIGNSAFCGCSGLTSITFATNAQLKYIHAYTFIGCENLTSITIPSGVTNIDNYAFERCRSLTSIIIPASVTSIGAHAFEECLGLSNITIPASVTSIGDFAFDSCTNLTNIIFQGTKEQWIVIEKMDDWAWNTGDYIITCTDGKIAKDGTIIE